MKAFKVASFRDSERRSLQLAARELGHGLQTRSQSELATIRRELSEVAEGVAGEYQRGFLDALEHLLAGLSAEVKHRRAVSDDAASARLRKNAMKVLLALHSGCDLPSQVAEKTGLRLPTVSNELAELEREELVERVEPSAGEDQRTSPRALTIRGIQIADHLTRTQASPTAEAAKDLAPVFVSFINQLADESQLARNRFEEVAITYLGAVNGLFVCDAFMKQAERQRIISVTNSAITLTTPFYRRRLRDLLQDAASSDRLLQPVKQLASSAAICLRATTAMRDQWMVALSRHDMRNVFVWCRDDARAEQLPSPLGPYHIVWENPQVMTRDLEERFLHPFLSKATRQLSYVAPTEWLPPEIERLEFDAYHLSR